MVLRKVGVSWKSRKFSKIIKFQNFLENCENPKNFWKSRFLWFLGFLWFCAPMVAINLVPQWLCAWSHDASQDNTKYSNSMSNMHSAVFERAFINVLSPFPYFPFTLTLLYSSFNLYPYFTFTLPLLTLLLHFALFYFTSRYFTWLHLTLLYFTRPYFTLLYVASLSLTFLHFTSLYFT